MGCTIRRMEGDNRLMTSKEVAAYLKVTERRVRQMAKSGEIVCEKLGRDYVFRLEDVKAYDVAHPPVLTYRRRKA